MALTYEKCSSEWTQMNRMKEEEVEVLLPRFKLEEDHDLGELGMTFAFDQATADFSVMPSKRDLCLSKLVHKALVEVNKGRHQGS